MAQLQTYVIVIRLFLDLATSWYFSKEVGLQPHLRHMSITFILPVFFRTQPPFPVSLPSVQHEDPLSQSTIIGLVSIVGFPLSNFYQLYSYHQPPIKATKHSPYPHLHPASSSSRASASPPWRTQRLQASLLRAMRATAWLNLLGLKLTVERWAPQEASWEVKGW